MIDNHGMVQDKPTIFVGTGMVGDRVLYGLINIFQQWVIPPSFTSIESFERKSGQIFKLKALNEKVGVADQYGNIVIPAIYEELLESDIEEKFLCLTLGDHYFICDSWGTIVVQAYCKSLRHFDRQGYTFIIELHDGKFGAIDRAGNWVIPPIYEKLFSWNEDGIAFYKNYFGYGLISNKGSASDKIYEKIKYRKNPKNLLSVKINGRWNLMDGNEGIATQEDYDNSVRYLFKDFALTKDGEDYVIFNGKKEILLEESLKDTAYNSKVFFGKYYGFWKIFNEKGFSETIQVTEMRLCRKSENYIIITNSAHKEGVVDIDGNIVIMPIYEKINCLNDNTFFAEESGHCYIIDGNGNMIFSQNGCKLEDFYKDTYILVSETEFWYIDRFGNKLYPFSFQIQNAYKEIFGDGYFFPNIPPSEYDNFIRNFNISEPIEFQYYFRSLNMFTPQYGFAIVRINGEKLLLINIEGFSGQILSFENSVQYNNIRPDFWGNTEELTYKNVLDEQFYSVPMPKLGEYRNLIAYINFYNK